MAQERIFKFWHYADNVSDSLFPKVILEGTDTDGLSTVAGEFPLEVGEKAFAGVRALIYAGTDGEDGAFFLDLLDGTTGYFSDSQDLSVGDNLPLKQFTEEPLPLDPDVLQLSINALPDQQDEGDVGTTAFDFEVTREGGDISQELTVDYRVRGFGEDPATVGEGEDILSDSTGQVTFAAAASTAVITVDVAGDTIDEPNEGFQVELFDPDNLGDIAAAASATIVNDDQAPELSITDFSQDEGNVDTKQFNVTVARTGNTDSETTVTWTATPSVDFPVDGGDFILGQPVTGTLTFAPDETTKDITFEVVGDTDVEPDETFTVTLSDPNNATLSQATATVTIQNDDTELVLTIEPVEASQAEGNSDTTPFEFTVTRAGGDLSQPLDVAYQIGGDIDGDDIDPSVFTGTVTFDPNADTAVITVDVVADAFVEADEALKVTLINPDNTTGATASSTIVNDDGAPVLSITDFSQDEGNADTKQFNVTVARTGNTDAETSVTWTATPSVDFPVDGGDFILGQPVTGTLTFAPDETTKDITFEVVGDTVVEPDEIFTVTLSNPNNATLSQATATVTIQNDDTELVLTIEPVEVSQDEGNSGTTPFEFTVTRAGGDLSQPLDVAYQIGGDIDGDDIDASAFTGTVTFEPNVDTAVITVDVVGDTLVEADEVLEVTLINPDNTTGAKASYTIVNDDQAPELSITDFSQAEGNADTKQFNVTVARTGNTDAETSVTWTATPSVDFPVDGGDFILGQPVTGTLTFAPDETTKDITFEVVGDTDVEADETFTVTLSDPNNATLSQATATVTIQNDDTELVLTIEPVEVSQDEGNSGTTPFEFTVTRAGGDLSQPLDVAYQIGGDIDGDDIDPSVFTGTVTFDPNADTAVITVDVVGDAFVEADEALKVTLINPDNTTGATASSTIVNDDGAPVLSITDFSQDEGNSTTTPFNVTVARTGNTDAETTVTWTAIPSVDFPVDGGDFILGQPVTGTLTFEAGEETKDITFEVTGDTDVEADETFTVTLSAPVNATLNPDATEATVTIENDDTELVLTIEPVNLEGDVWAEQDEGDSGTTPFEFTVTRAGGDLSQPLDVDYQIGGDIEGDDIDPPSAFTGTVTFKPNADTAVITVNVVGDTLVEADEVLEVTLINPDNTTGAKASYTIVNDDQAPELSITDFSQAEGNADTKQFNVTVARTGNTDAETTVTWTANSSVDFPVDGGDFILGQPVTGTLTFAPDETTKDITFEVVGDTVVEPDETFTVTLSQPNNATLSQATATVTIENDDTELVLTIEPVEVSQDEGNSGTTPFEFTVTRAGGDLSQPLDVAYQIGGDIDGDDIDPSVFTGTVTFEPNVDTAVISIDVVGDILVESNEVIEVKLINPDNTIGATASAIIVDDDGPPPIDPEDFNVIDGDYDNNYLQGTKGNDLIRGFARTDILEGKDGDDILSGDAGTDVLYGDDGNDILSGGGGVDILEGGMGDDILIGGTESDIIKGGTGNDFIFGGVGEDIIQGDEGNDILTGGIQSDVFFFTGLFGDDTITDFNDTQDGLIFESAEQTEITAEEVDNGLLITVESDEAMGTVLLLGVTDLNEIT